MKFSCNQQQLTKALNIASKAVTNHTTIPILKGFLLTAENGILKISSSDLDLSIETKLPVSVSEPGSIVVSARLFGDIVRKLPNEEIQVEESEENIDVNVAYALEANYEHLADCRIQMNIKSKDARDFKLQA